MAALSESPAIGMCATASQASTTSSGRPARSAPMTSVPCSGPHSAPALLEDAERAGARAQARDAVEQVGLHVDPGAQLVHRRPAGICGGRQQVLALGHEAPLATALELADLLQLLVVRAGDHGVG